MTILGLQHRRGSSPSVFSFFFKLYLEIEQKNGIFAHAKPLIILNSYLYVFERRIDF